MTVKIEEIAAVGCSIRRPITSPMTADPIPNKSEYIQNRAVFMVEEVYLFSGCPAKQGNEETRGHGDVKSARVMRKNRAFSRKDAKSAKESVEMGKNKD